jgi:Carboxypeptidase regulatory-like domain
MCGSGGSPNESMDGGSEVRDAGVPVAGGCPPLPGHIRVTVRYAYGAQRPLLDGAEVELRGPSGGMQTTGPAGEVIFRDLPPGGGYSVYVTRRCVHDSTAPTSVTEDTTTPVEVVVTPTGTMRGRVTDADNANNATNGIAGATVTLEGTGQSATTDAQGGFEFRYLPSDTYHVRATKAGHTRNTVDVVAQFRPCETVNTTVPIRVITLEIVDRRTGTVISGTNVTKIVGQKIQLEVRTRPAGETMTNIRWTIPGDRVKDYTQAVGRGRKTDLPAADLQRAQIDYHWINLGTPAVQVQAQVNGANLSATVNYNVLRPTMNTFTTAVSSVNLCVGTYFQPGTFMAAYQPGPPARFGCQWNGKATAPAAGGGQIGFTQLINADRRFTNNAGTVRRYTSGGRFVLDDALGIQYSGPQPIAANAAATLTGASYADSPNNPLTAADQSTSASDDFQLYLMYKHSDADSIWVTLGKATWGWRGNITRIGAPASPANNWNAPTGTGMPNTNGVNSIELPEWAINYTAVGWS